MTRLRPDSLFARIFLLQLGVALLLCTLFLLAWLWQDRTGAVARSVAPTWAAALQPVAQALRQGQTPSLPAQSAVEVAIELLPGPPPRGARHIGDTPRAPRYALLQRWLRAQQIPVGAMAVSGEDGEAVTWLELRPEGRPALWVGVRGALEEPGLRGRALLAMGLSLLVFLGAAAWLSQRIARPLQTLQQRVRHFADTGQMPPPMPPQGPREVRELARQFDSFAAQRQQDDDARQMMLAGISHDLRSPLGRIRMAAELLPQTPEVAQRRESIVRNAQVADQLVGSFLALVRSATEPLDERVDLRALVQRLLGNGDHEDVRLDLQTQQALWLQPASAAQLERALVNLLDNARRYGQPPIEVRLQSAHGQALLTVRDHGPGIPPDQRETLLKPFYRGSADRLVPGTGLGLPVVQRCVRRHGGELRLENAAPGLAVHIALPLAGSQVDA